MTFIPDLLLSFTGADGAEGTGPSANITSLLQSEYCESKLIALYLAMYKVPGAPSESVVTVRVYV